MKITGVKWLGVRTEAYDATVAFFRDTLELEMKETQETFTGFRTPNGDEIEVFRPEDVEHAFFTTGPVAGFGVEDVAASRQELEAAGIELIGPLHDEAGGRWSHFRGPDGNVYEITEA